MGASTAMLFSAVAEAEKRRVSVELPRRRREDIDVVWLRRVSRGGRVMGVGSSKEMEVRGWLAILGEGKGIEGGD